MATALFDARFSLTFGWDYTRKCWVVQIRDAKRNLMLMRRDVHTSTAMSTLEHKRLLGVVASEMESWLPW